MGWVAGAVGVVPWFRCRGCCSVVPLAPVSSRLCRKNSPACEKTPGQLTAGERFSCTTGGGPGFQGRTTARGAGAAETRCAEQEFRSSSRLGSSRESARLGFKQVVQEKFACLRENPWSAPCGGTFFLHNRGRARMARRNPGRRTAARNHRARHGTTAHGTTAARNHPAGNHAARNRNQGTRRPRGAQIAALGHKKPLCGWPLSPPTQR